METTEMTTAQRAAVENYWQGDAIVRVEAEHNGAVHVMLASGMTMIVEANGTLLDDSGDVRVTVTDRQQ